jgi:hypothetical protein
MHTLLYNQLILGGYLFSCFYLLLHVLCTYNYIFFNSVWERNLMERIISKFFLNYKSILEATAKAADSERSIIGVSSRKTS